MSAAPSTPNTMLVLAAHAQWRTQNSASEPKRHVQLRVVLRRTLATLAVMIGLSSVTMGTAQAWVFDDMKDNIASTMVNMCGPNDVATPTTHHNIDTEMGMNNNPSKGARATVLPNWKKAGNGAGDGSASERLQKVYGDKATTIAPTYERYGFSSLRWSQYGYDCFSPTLLMGPASNMALFSMVHVPMMISMSVLNFAMDNTLYASFAAMMEPFIGGMYQLFSPWIFFIVPIGIFMTWVTSKASLQATLKAASWGVLILSVFLVMGQSTSRVVTWSTNIVTEVAGSAACKMNAAAADDKSGAEEECDPKDPIKSVNQALWYGVPYQTWLTGQVGSQQAAADRAVGDGEATWGAAILNGNYVGVTKDGAVDKEGRKVLENVEDWNGRPYTDDGKVQAWGKGDAWNGVPALTNVKLLCNDQDKVKDGTGTDPGEAQRWMFSGAAGENGGGSYYCDSAGAGTTSMVSTFKGDEYNKQFLTAVSGMIGVGAVALTIGGSALYLAFQKMSFYFLLFFAPIVLTISALGDNKRRPFAIRYAELIAANLLKQVAAVCIVLFVSHAMASLFGSSNFSSVPWALRPYAAGVFFLALVMMAFPMKNLLKGAVQGDTSSLDKIANTPANAVKTGAKVAAVTTAVAATGGAAAGGGGGVMAGMGGKAAVLGKGGTMLGQAGKVMGMGSKTGKTMRRTGALIKAGQGVMDSQDAKKGRQAAMGQAAASLINGPEGGKYRDEKGQLLPNAKKMAEKDVAKMSEAGQKSDRATKAQDTQMAQFFNGYKATTGNHHRDDPESPDNKRKARAEAEQERRHRREDADQLSTDGSIAPQGPAKSAHRRDDDDGGDHGPRSPGSDRGGPKGPKSHGPNEGATDFTPTKESFREKARANLAGPGFAREMDYDVATAATGEEVLRKNGLTKSQVLADPTTLLRGEAYEGGSTTKMDPFNPATSALNELRFASASGDEDAMEGAVAKSVDAITEHGVPDQITGVHSIGDRAKSFESIELLGAMPSITQDTPWHERAEAAQTMMAAQVAMPEDYQGRAAVEDYTSALANPAVDPTSLEAMKSDAIKGIEDNMHREGFDLSEGGGTMSPNPNGQDGGQWNPQVGDQGPPPGAPGAAMAGAFVAGDATNGGGQQPAVQQPAVQQPAAPSVQEPSSAPSSTPGDYQPAASTTAPEQSPPAAPAVANTQQPAAQEPSAPAPQEPSSAPHQQAVQEPSAPAPQEPQAANFEQPAPQPNGGGDQPSAPHAEAYQGEATPPPPPMAAPVSGPTEYVAPSEGAPHAESPSASYEAPEEGGGGVTRDELRQAVAEGVRESRMEQQSPPEAATYSEAPAPAPHQDANFASADFFETPPETPSALVESSAPACPAPVGPAQFRSSSAESSEGGSGPSVEPVPEDEGIFFRPDKKRRDEEETDEIEPRNPLGEI